MIAALNCILIFGPNSARYHPVQSAEVSEITQRGIQSTITKALICFPSSLWALIAEKTFISFVVSGNFNPFFPYFACLVSPPTVQCCFASWIIFSVIQYLQPVGHPQLLLFPSLISSLLHFPIRNLVTCRQCLPARHIAALLQLGILLFYHSLCSAEDYQGILKVPFQLTGHSENLRCLLYPKQWLLKTQCSPPMSSNDQNHFWLGRPIVGI